MNRAKMGFTLLETVIAVTLLIILSAVGFATATRQTRSMERKELDECAQIIYHAAQNRMTELMSSGFASVVEKSDDTSVFPLPENPSDLPAELVDANKLCYISSDSKNDPSSAVAAVLPDGSIDLELWQNNWIIEYNPHSGSVYGVFYSESQISEDTDLNKLRSESARKSSDLPVGYYGGNAISVEDPLKLAPYILGENNEKLSVTLCCPTLENHRDDQFKFVLTLSDTQGNSVTKTYPHSQLEYDGLVYRKKIELDSLKEDALRFNKQFPELVAGTELRVDFTVESSNELSDDASAKPWVTNSLFAYDSTLDASTAVICYGRHLQNLDKNSSGVIKTITKAVQKRDISFKPIAGDSNCWASVYGHDFYFKPIYNAFLMSYSGSYLLPTDTASRAYTSIKGLNIHSSTDAGLFEVFWGNQLSDIVLLGAHVEGDNVGALAGAVMKYAEISSCHVYLEDEDITEKAESQAALDAWLTGNCVGGLVGRSNDNLTIQDSFVSTVIESTDDAGGLLGAGSGETVTLSNCYASSYIKAADIAGGLSSVDRLDINNCYTAGYILAKTAAGFTKGNINYSRNAYTAVFFNEGCETTYSSALSGTSVSNVYYLNEGTASEKIGTQITLEQLSDKNQISSLLGSSFTGDNAGSNSNPYKLLNQELDEYPFPRLANLAHYGDWVATKKEEEKLGALVYYEKYSDGTMGFFNGTYNTIRPHEIPVGDGYCLLIDKGAGDKWNKLNIILLDKDGNKIEDYDAKSHRISYDGTLYYVPLPNDFYTLAPDTGSFYHKVLVTDGHKSTENYYLYNPFFAKSVRNCEKSTDPTTVKASATICVSTARHLNKLSQYYNDFKDATLDSTFFQERDIDYSSYDWRNFDTSTVPISAQGPIGRSGLSFDATYDGNFCRISGVSISSNDEKELGLFSTVGKSGVVCNVNLCSEFNYGQYTQSFHYSGTGDHSLGAIAGYNKGLISNCSVSGYTVRATGSQNCKVMLGGLVGVNVGEIDSCSAVLPQIEINGSGEAYVGGFVGLNSENGRIRKSYCISNITANGNVDAVLGGFAGGNDTNSSCDHCYTLTAILDNIKSSEVYGFTKAGGSVTACYYLDGGYYEFNAVGSNHNYSENAYRGSAAGTPTPGANITSRLLGTGFASALETEYNYNTDDPSGAGYPYPCSVSNRARTYVHRGDWPVPKMPLGVYGIFYWENERGGQNAGYHISVLGFDVSGDSITYNNLCTEHSCAGKVQEYGYGFYSLVDSIGYSFNTNGGNYLPNNSAGDALKLAFNSYAFTPYTTGTGKNQVKNIGKDANITWSIKHDVNAIVNTKSFLLSPFFANSMSIVGQGSEPGVDANPYMLRSIAQLQYMAWNSKANNVTSEVDNIDHEHNKSFAYLAYTWKVLFWEIVNDFPYSFELSHDIDAKNMTFITIGNTTRFFTEKYVYFNGTLEGNSYSLKNFSSYPFYDQFKIGSIENVRWDPDPRQRMNASLFMSSAKSDAPQLMWDEAEAVIDLAKDRIELEINGELEPSSGKSLHLTVSEELLSEPLDFLLYDRDGLLLESCDIADVMHVYPDEEGHGFMVDVEAYQTGELIIEASTADGYTSRIYITVVDGEVIREEPTTFAELRFSSPYDISVCNVYDEATTDSDDEMPVVYAESVGYGNEACAVLSLASEDGIALEDFVLYKAVVDSDFGSYIIYSSDPKDSDLVDTSSYSLYYPDDSHIYETIDPDSGAWLMSRELGILSAYDEEEYVSLTLELVRTDKDGRTVKYVLCCDGVYVCNMHYSFCTEDGTELASLTVPYGVRPETPYINTELAPEPEDGYVYDFAVWSCDEGTFDLGIDELPVAMYDLVFTVQTVPGYDTKDKDRDDAPSTVAPKEKEPPKDEPVPAEEKNDEAEADSSSDSEQA